MAETGLMVVSMVAVRRALILSDLITAVSEILAAAALWLTIVTVNSPLAQSAKMVRKGAQQPHALRRRSVGDSFS